MDTVKAFNAELYSLYESKPPISKAKMTAITKGAIKAVKFYKHVVQSVEKFLQKCRVEYKIPGLYVIDSIVRQSRHQFGADKDVFAARFSKNINITFFFIYQCSNEEKSKVIRVLNLWQKNSIFQPDVIQPLFDMADSSHPKYKEVEQFVTSKGAQGPSSSKAATSSEKETNSAAAGTGRDPASFSAFDDSSNDNSKGQLLMGNLPPVNSSEMSLATRLQHLQHLFNPEAAPPAAPPPKPPTNPSDTGQIRFNKNLLDFDYGEEDDEPAAAASRDIQQLQQKPNDSLGNLLTNPEILRHLQSLQQQITQPAINMNLLGSAAAAAAMAGLPQGLTAAANEKLQQQQGFGTVDLSQPPPGFPLLSMGMPINLPHLHLGPHMQSGFGDLAFGAQGPQQVPFQQLADRREEAVNPFQSNNNDTSVTNDGENHRSRDKERRRSSRSRSRSASRGRSQRSRHRKGSRSRSRSRDRDRRRRSRTRSRSPHGGRSQRRRSRSKEREKERLEREKERERKRKGLPNLKKEHLSVCSTTLWVGHLSKLVQQEELSDTFGQYGDIVSIDLIPPRGCAFVCMHRRQDAYRALNKLAGHKLQGKAITLAWAPGKGVKSKEWKDYWELEQGVSYIPWSKISSATDLESLEEGGSIDEESLPPWLQKNGNFQDGQPGFIPMPEGPPLVGPGPPTPETASLPADSMVSTPAAGNPPGPPLTGATTLPPNLPTYGMGNIHSSLGLMHGGGLVPGVPLGLAPGLPLPPPPGLPGLLVPPNPQMQNLINQQILAGVGPIPLQQLMNQNVNLPGEPPGGGFPFRPAPPAPPHNNNDDDMELEDADEHNAARDDEIAARERAWENDDDDDQSNHLPPSQDPKANLPSLLERLRSLAHSDNVVPSPQRIAFNPDERNANPERGMDGGPPLMPRPPMEGPPHFAMSPNLASNLRGAPLTASGELGMRLIRPGGMGPNEPFGPPPMMGNHPGSPFGPPPGGFTPIRGPPAGPGPATPRMGHPGPGPGPRGLMMFDARGPRNFGPGLQGPDFGGEADRRPPQQQPWGEPWWREREEERFRDVPEWERDRVHPGPPDRGQWGRDDRGGGPMDSRRGRDWNRKPMRNEHDRGSAGRDRFARDRDRNPRRPPPPRNGERSDRDRDRRSAGRGSGRWGPPTPGGPRPSDPRELPNRVNDAATNHSEDISTDQPQPPSPQGDSSLSRPPEEERTLAVPGEEEESVDAAKSPRPAAGDDSQMADVNSNSDIITNESG